jgi:hypothetical protein
VRTHHSIQTTVYECTIIWYRLLTAATTMQHSHSTYVVRRAPVPTFIYRSMCFRSTARLIIYSHRRTSAPTIIHNRKRTNAHTKATTAFVPCAARVCTLVAHTACNRHYTTAHLLATCCSLLTVILSMYEPLWWCARTPHLWILRMSDSTKFTCNRWGGVLGSHTSG